MINLFITYMHTLKHAGLNMDEPSNRVVFTQQLGYCSEGWVKHLTQLLVENNPASVLSNNYSTLGCI